MPADSLGCRSKDGLRQFRRFFQPGWQRDPANRLLALILFPSRASQIASSDAFDRKRLSPLYEHRSVFKERFEFMQRSRKLTNIGRHEMVGDYVLHHLKPEERHLGQNDSFLRDGRSKDEVKSRDSVGGNDEKIFIDLVNVSHLASAEKLVIW